LEFEVVSLKSPVGHRKVFSEVEGLEGDLLGSDEEFAGERGFGGTPAEGFFGGKAREIGVVVFLGDVREDKIARTGIEAFRIGEEFTDRVI